MREKRKHDEESLKSWKNQKSDCEGSECEEDESRSSCTGSSCDNPIILDQHHQEIQLDSLEDLAHVIDDEVIHRREGHDHVDPGEPGPPREYEPFITDDPKDGVLDQNPVKVAAVNPPEKHFLPDYEAYKAPDRFSTKYEIDEIPLFDLGYK